MWLQYVPKRKLIRYKMSEICIVIFRLNEGPLWTIQKIKWETQSGMECPRLQQDVINDKRWIKNVIT